MRKSHRTLHENTAHVYVSQSDRDARCHSFARNPCRTSNANYHSKKRSASIIFEKSAVVTSGDPLPCCQPLRPFRTGIASALRTPPTALTQRVIAPTCVNTTTAQTADEPITPNASHPQNPLQCRCAACRVPKIIPRASHPHVVFGDLGHLDRFA